MYIRLGEALARTGFSSRGDNGPARNDMTDDIADDSNGGVVVADADGVDDKGDESRLRARVVGRSQAINEEEDTNGCEDVRVKGPAVAGVAVVVPDDDDNDDDDDDATVKAPHEEADVIDKFTAPILSSVTIATPLLPPPISSTMRPLQLLLALLLLVMARPTMW